MSFGRYIPELNVFQTVAAYGHSPDKKHSRVLPMPEDTRDHWATLWAEMEEIEIVNDPAQFPDVRKLCQDLGVDLNFSYTRLRLELEGRRIGELWLSIDRKNAYTAEHGDLVRVLHEPMAVAMANALQHSEVLRLSDMLADDNRFLHRQLSELSGGDVIGADFGLREVMTMAQQVAPLDSPVLLMGETGVGKGVVANAIHLASPRREGPFINVNCGAIPETLIDSELFGHEKGAFTGALSRKRGRFERAHGGTIFLDEIGELPPQAQVRLLNVVQNKEIERVGGTAAIPVDIRIISATNRNLQEMMQSGRFREDLWFRLNVFPIMIPPLRQRKEDIPALMHHFIEKKSRELKFHNKPRLARGAMDRLMAYDWPGNVRELENLVERALIQQRNDTLTFENLASSQLPHTKKAPEREESGFLTLEEMNRQYIKRALKKARGKINGPGGLAELLDIHPNTLRKRMQKLEIHYKRTRGKSGQFNTE